MGFRACDHVSQTIDQCEIAREDLCLLPTRLYLFIVCDVSRLLHPGHEIFRLSGVKGRSRRTKSKKSCKYCSEMRALHADRIENRWQEVEKLPNRVRGQLLSPCKGKGRASNPRQVRNTLASLPCGAQRPGAGGPPATASRPNSNTGGDGTR